MIDEIFYVTGRGGTITDGLCLFLRERSKTISGISLSSAFLNKPFGEQLAEIAEHFERIERNKIPVIANSYGVYLLLNSLISREKLRTKVLLLSPVIGTLVSQLGYFRPAYANRIPTALRDGNLKKPEYLAICVGRLDNQCDINAIEQLSITLNADNLSILDGQGHMIDKQLVQTVVDNFLESTKT